jgi:bacteriophage N4 adsorption protein B
MHFSIDQSQLWTWILFWQQELLLFSAFWFFVGAADDVLVDLIWMVRALYRRLTVYRKYPALDAEHLPAPEESGLMVVLIPAWQEARVIGEMLARTRLSWSESGIAYRVYVGCYPNDPASVAQAMRSASFDPAVRIVLCERPGPTTKADCLNRLWRALCSDEANEGIKAKAVILHDAEDSVHPDALRIFDYLIERAQAVQLPVIPVRVPGSPWISGHYCDEFAEAHGKTLVVREAIGAALPLAGVGCAIQRSILDSIAQNRSCGPFDPGSLTEDYELGLGIGRQGGKVILARMADRAGNIVGTRACFPDRLDASVRQKARWMTGIALAGWDRLGWSGGFAEFWMRIRDRKAVFAAIVLTTAYLCIVLTVILIIGHAAGGIELPSLSEPQRLLLVVNGLILIWRLFIRAVFVWQAQGWREAIRSVPRTILANIIAIMAARRACWSYLKHIFGGKLAWEKTSHTHFPVDAGRHG